MVILNGQGCEPPPHNPPKQSFYLVNLQQSGMTHRMRTQAQSTLQTITESTGWVSDLTVRSAHLAGSLQQ